MKNKYDERAKEFLGCLGNGKTIYQCEAENDMIDDLFLEEEVKYWFCSECTRRKISKDGVVMKVCYVCQKEMEEEDGRKD